MNELTTKEKRVLWCVLNQAQDSGLKSLAHLIKVVYGDGGVKLEALNDWFKQTQEEYDIVNTLKAKLCGDEE
jgi:hypothetical protein